MNEQLILRLAEESDYGAVCALLKEGDDLDAELYPEWFISPEAPHIKRSTFISWLEDEKDAFWVAEHENRLVGLMQMYVDDDSGSDLRKPYRAIHIQNLQVTRAYRDQGIGKKFLAKAEEWTREKDTAYLELHVRPENARAMHLYEKVGFKEISRFMRKTL